MPKCPKFQGINETDDETINETINEREGRKVEERKEIYPIREKKNLRNRILYPAGFIGEFHQILMEEIIPVLYKVLKNR